MPRVPRAGIVDGVLRALRRDCRLNMDPARGLESLAQEEESN